MKKVIILVLVIIFGYLGYSYVQKYNWVHVSQNISKVGFNISLDYNQKHWEVKKGEGFDDLFKIEKGWIRLNNKEYEDVYIDLRYELENNGDDTSMQVGDTGAPLFPPQRGELVKSFEKDKYLKVGEQNGFELYTSREIDWDDVVYQRLNQEELTATMPILSKDKARVNYYDKFVITAHYGENEGDYKKLHKEFIEIIKSMQIEKIDETKTAE